MNGESNQSLELAGEAKSGAVVKFEYQQGPTAAKIMTLIEKMVERGATKAEDAVALEKMTDLLIKMQAIDAKRDFVLALKAFQDRCQVIVATTPVMNSERKGGGLRYKFAEFPDIMKVVKPIADELGFIIQFSETDANPGRIAKQCILTHLSGHSHIGKYSVRIGQGPPGANETQADGSAHTYAKRGALCDALNIVVDKDTDGAPDDASLEGADITKAQALDLMKRVQATGSDEFKFLALAMGTKLSPDSATREQINGEYYKITQAMFPELDAFLAKRERIQAAKR